MLQMSEWTPSKVGVSEAVILFDTVLQQPVAKHTCMQCIFKNPSIPHKKIDYVASGHIEISFPDFGIATHRVE
jgi:hypothetical protein